MLILISHVVMAIVFSNLRRVEKWTDKECVHCNDQRRTLNGQKTAMDLCR